MIVALQRLRRAASISLEVPAVRDEIKNAIDAFDEALPGLARQRNAAEHFDEYAKGIDARGADAVSDYLERYVHAPATWIDYLDLFGGERLARQGKNARELT